mmetsp:Transcript_91493/g.191252  ORF Transcript_91493/g.191252 Transcript_91493/m.191252 type:complete len:329 (+) Transcript_91493:165-1151(+)
MLLLEHINLFIPDPELGRRFYEALGLQLNRESTNHRQVHLNAGFSQMHLVMKRNIRPGDPVEVPQRWLGEVELWSQEDKSIIIQRLQADDMLVAAGVTVEEEVEAGGAWVLLVQGPWEVRKTWRITPAPAGFADALRSSGKGHNCGFAGIVAMSRISHPCRPGSAELIADFYRTILGSNEVEVKENDTSSAGGSLKLKKASVVFRMNDTLPPQYLDFEEQEDAPPADAFDHDEVVKYHVCLYMKSDADFQNSYQQAERAGLVWVNDRFEGDPANPLASARTWEEAEAAQQYRVKDLRGLDSERPGLVLEHEIRSWRHFRCPLLPAQKL